mgnify:CR=1 FL=1
MIKMKKSIYYKALALCLLLLFAQGAAAVVFEVTTAEEFQSALAAASQNSSNDEINLSGGVYSGNFRYKGAGSGNLTITGSDRVENPSIVDGLGSAYGLLIDELGSDDAAASTSTTSMLLEISHLRFENIKNIGRNGAALVLAGRRDSSAIVSDLEILIDEVSEGGAISLSGFSASIARVLFSGSGYVQNLIYVDCSGVRSNSVAILQPDLDIKNNSWGYLLNTSGSCGDTDFTFETVTTFVSGSSRINAFNLGAAADIEIKDSVIGSSLGPIYGQKISISDTEFRNVSLGFKVDKVNLLRNRFFDSSANFKSRGQRTAVSLVNNLLVNSAVSSNGSYSAQIHEIEFLSNTIVDTSLNLAVSESGLDSRISFVNNILSAGQPFELEINSLPNLLEARSNIFNDVGAPNLWDVYENNLNTSPQFYDAENLDFHLQADSPAIDAGSDDVVADGASDLDGNPRLVGGGVDIGAYERSTTALHPADSNGDQSISQAEFDAYNTAWRTNDTWPTAPSIIPIDFVTRAGYLLQKGGAYKNIGVGKPATWVPLAD